MSPVVLLSPAAPAIYYGALPSTLHLPVGRGGREGKGVENPYDPKRPPSLGPTQGRRGSVGSRSLISPPVSGEQTSPES